MKLYQYKVNEGFGPELINDNINSTRAGELCFKHGKHEEYVFLLLHQGRLYYSSTCRMATAGKLAAGKMVPSFVRSERNGKPISRT